MVLRGSFYSLIGITLLLSFIAYYISEIPKRQMEQGRWVTHTHQVLGQLDTLSVALSEARADHTSIDHTVNTTQRITENIQDLTTDNAVQQARIEPLRKAITAELTNPGPDKAEEVIERIDAMRSEEEELLTKRERNWSSGMFRSRIFLFAGVILVYALMLFSFTVARREARAREQLLEMESEAVAAQRNIALRMSQIVEVQQDIISQRLNLDRAMEVITRRTQRITHADGAVIEMLDGEEMLYRAASGTMEPYIGLRLKAAGSMSGLCIAVATPLRCDDSETDERVDKEACRKVGLRSMIVVPLMHMNEVIGVLKVASARVNAFTMDELQTLQLMAGVLSATLRDAVAAEALQDSHKSLNFKNELLNQQKTQLESDKQELKNRADTDGMTGLKNHRYFQEHLNIEYARAKRYGNALSLIMCDVDYFKQFNDQYGHPAGDAVLNQVATIIKASARPSDCVARYGGEEFAIILTQTPLDGAVTVAGRIRDAIHQASWAHRPVTISIGVTSLENGAKTTLALIEQADKALYESKAEGRDKITAFSKA